MPPQAKPPASSETKTLLVTANSALSTDQQQDLVKRNGGNRKSYVPALNLLVVNVPSAEAADHSKRYQA
ncbi:MAG: hypothetical protein M3326_02855, partial [Actinomycetota bacterium]|nr:hypothetical protein [Actinomycetota bacterium]